MCYDPTTTPSHSHPSGYSEDIYVNHETIDRTNHCSSYVSSTSTLLNPTDNSYVHHPARPLDDAQKSYQLADLYEEINHYKKENTLLRDSLYSTNKKYEQIVREYQTRIFDLEKEREMSTPSLRPLVTRSESVSYSSTTSLSAELAMCREEALNLKVVADSYAEDVKNINQKLTESQRAKNILSRELQDKNEAIRRIEDEVASLTFLLNEKHSSL